MRVCGDYSLTVNPVIVPDSYPLPRIDDLLASLAGGESFTKLDLSGAYQQVELDEESKKLLTVNTPWGLFRYNRLPFGVSVAPAIFQRIVDSLLQGVPGTVVYLDDTLVTGKSREEHLRNLELVLGRLAFENIKNARFSFLWWNTEGIKLIKRDSIRPMTRLRQSRTHRPPRMSRSSKRIWVWSTIMKNSSGTWRRSWLRCIVYSKKELSGNGATAKFRLLRTQRKL